jgi:AraC family transcriptional regulator of adaptative response/methylated-DNA-[protein]-cysteine methyltransferase
VKLSDLSAEFGVSPFHLQRTFKRVAGVTPKQYLVARRSERLKRELRGENGVASAVYGAGYGSSSQVYGNDRLGMTPAKYRRRGEGMDIRYTVVMSSLGRMLVAATDRGISAVSFGDTDKPLEDHLFSEYEAAAITRDDVALRPWVEQVLRSVDRGEQPAQLPFDIRATAFRAKVYEALRQIPLGETRTYADIARAVGSPKAVRAVGTACKVNPTAVITPCHRVVRTGGDLGGYRWGLDRKKKLLEQERRAADRRRA